MADNYLERREEELRSARPAAKKHVNTSLDTLLKRNRSYRGYDPAKPITEATLREIVSVTTLVASGMNAQRLRFRLIPTEKAAMVHPLIKLGAALPQEHLPHPGTEPQGYIVVCAEGGHSKIVDIDLGIAAQSMLLKAVDMGLNGIMVLNFKPEELKQTLDLPLEPLMVIGIGKGAERIFLTQAQSGGSLNYYRKDGVHFVPKLSVDELIV